MWGFRLLLLVRSSHGLLYASPRRVDPGRHATTEDLRADFALADNVAKFTIEVASGKKYTFWSALRQLPSLQRYNASTLRTMSDQGGDEPPVLDDWTERGTQLVGNVDGRRKVCDVVVRDAVEGVSFIVDGRDDVYELGAPSDEKNGLPAQTVLSTFGLALLLFVAWLQPHPQPTSFYYYSETSTSVTRRNPDGTYNTQTERSVQSNFRPF